VRALCGLSEGVKTPVVTGRGGPEEPRTEAAEKLDGVNPRGVREEKQDLVTL
jgi:hypothetical protein